jgi:AraC family transcriptional regulator
MEPRIVTRAPFALVGLQIRTQPMSPDIPALWPKFVPRMHEIAHPAEPGVTYGWMRTPLSEPGVLVYLAGVPVTQVADVPEGMTAITLEAAEVAVFEFPFHEIGAAYEFIFGEWLRTSGYAPADAPLLERYGADFFPDASGSTMQIQVPIRPRG